MAGGSCVSCSSCCGDRILTRVTYLRRKGFFGPKAQEWVQSVMAGKSKKWKCEAAGHISRAVRKQRGLFVFISFSLFYSVPRHQSFYGAAHT